MRIFPASGCAMADERLEQRRLARPVRPDERHVLLTLDHERAAFDQLLPARREPEPFDLDHDPAAARRLQELEAEAPSPLRQVLELAGGLLALLLEATDLRELRLGLLRLRFLVAEPLDESLQPLDVGADPLHALRRGLGPCRPLEPPLVPGAGEVEAAAALELEHRRRHRLEEPAVVRDEDHRRVDRRQLALEPLEALDVEVVRRLVEQQQVGIAGKRAGERGARQLAAGERGELAVEVGVAEAEAAEHRCGAVAPAPAAGMLEPRLRLAVALQRRLVVRAGWPSPARAREAPPRSGRGGGPRDRVLTQRQAAVARRALIVERDAGALLQRDLAALDRRLADDRPQQRRLAGAVLARERKPLPPVDRERDPVEEGISGELLAEIRCDQDGHGTRVDAAARSWRYARSTRGLGSPHPDGRHDSRARDGRGAAGERRPSRHGDGARAGRVPPLPRRDAPQPGRSALAGSRPLRPLGRSRLRAAVRRRSISRATTSRSTT